MTTTVKTTVTAEMKPLYVVKESEATLHISKGNSKIGKGIWAFSTLPGNDKNMLVLNHSVLLTDVPGTCSKYCDSCFNGGCYAVGSALLHHNVVIKSWADNTLLLRSGKLWDMLEEFISSKNKKYYETRDDADKKVCTFRINVSGEMESLSDFEHWNKIAINHPEVNFGVYTKNFDDLGKFLDAHEKTADNLCVNVSQWNHVADDFIEKYKNAGLNVFEYDETNRAACDWSDEDKKRLSSLAHCPAVDKKGHHAKNPVTGEDITCDHCKRCYTKTGRVTAVYAH